MRAALLVSAALALVTSPARADPPRPMRSPALVAGGTVLAVAGAAAVTLGLIRVVVSEACPGTCANPGRNEAIGGAVLGAGLGVLAGGIVMIVLGARPAPAAARGPMIVGAPGGAALRISF